MKLRGAYVLLTPGYGWLDQALIGSSDWGQFDPFTVGQVRYIDRDNYNGLYFKGAASRGAAAGNSAACRCRTTCRPTTARDASCCSSDDTQFNEAVYIAQAKGSSAPPN
jgi:hypothetical protein